MAGAKKAVDFEAAQQKLEEILQRLSEDDVSLDESVTLYATASELIAQCSAALKNAEDVYKRQPWSRRFFKAWPRAVLQHKMFPCSLPHPGQAR